MESLETAALFPDDLFDFSSDIGDGDEEYDTNKPFSSYSSSSSSAAALNSNLANVNTQQKQQQQHKHHQVQKQEVLDIFDSDNHPSVPEFLEEEEEELEWLNEDAFPSIESLDDILPMRLKEETKLQSPTSVLENGSNSNGNSSSSNGRGGIMTCCGSLRVPVRARSRRRRRKRRSFSDTRGQQLWWCELKSKSSTAGATTPANIGRKCWHCFAEKTPQWRAGPFGPKTLCNACGVRYKSGRLVPEYRPASSPSFSTELHSNSHRKILEMRRHRQKEMVLESFDKG